MCISHKHFATFALLFPLVCMFSVRVLGQDNAVDICIIGAGPAGMTAAYFAEAKGYRVAVIEKNSYVGGRTKIFEAGDGTRYPMGAAIHIGSKLLNKLLTEFNISKDDVISGPRKYYRGTDMVDWNPLSLKVVSQLHKYVKVRISLRKYLDRAEPFLSEYPTELNKPMGLWLDENGMSAIKPLFSPLLTSFGYGHIQEVPAIYALKCVTTRYISQLFIPFRMVVPFVMFQDLFTAMAAELEGHLYLNSVITSVTYENDINVVDFLHDGNNVTLHCGSIIFAFIPTPSAMVNLIPPGLEISPLLEKIQIIQYYTLLLDDGDGDVSNGRAFFYHTPLPTIPDDPAINVFYWKAQDRVDSRVAAYYLTPSEKSDQQAQTESLLHYNRLFNKNVNVEGIYDFNRWDYFPHLSTTSLNEGFFQAFEMLQGQFHQYYTGSLFTFDLVELAMLEGQKVIEKHF